MHVQISRARASREHKTDTQRGRTSVGSKVYTRRGLSFTRRHEQDHDHDPFGLLLVDLCRVVGIRGLSGG